MEFPHSIQYRNSILSAARGFWIVICILVFVLSLAGCPSTNTAVQPDNLPKKYEETVQLANKLIVKGSSTSLIVAYDLLNKEGIREYTLSRQKRYAAAAFLELVYPALKANAPKPSFDEANIYKQIYDSVRRGTLHDISADAVTYNMQVLNSTAFLYAREDIAYEQITALVMRTYEMNPAAVIPAFLRGYVLEKRGEHDQALAAYEETLAIDDACYPAVAGRVRMLSGKGEWNEALLLANKLNTKYPGSGELTGLLARVYMDAGNYKKADELLAEAVAISGDPELLYMRARLAVAQEQWDTAELYVSMVQDNTSLGARARILQAKILHEGRRKPEAAINILAEAAAQYADNIDVKLLYARYLLENQEYDTAGNVLKSIFDRGVENTAASRLIVQLHIEKKEFLFAVNKLAPLLSGKPAARNRFLAFLAYEGLSQYDTALDYVSSLYLEDPSNEQYMVAYTRALVNAGRSEKAREVLSEIKQTGPGQTTLSMLYYYEAFLNAGEERIGLLKQAVNTDPENIDALIMLAEIYSRRQDYNTALFYMRQASQIEPDNVVLSSRVKSLERLLR